MTRHFSSYEESLQSEKLGAEANRAVLGQILQAIVNDNYQDIAPHLTEDVELDIHGFPLMNGSWSGREDVVAGMRRNFSLVMDQRPRVLEMMQSGDVIVMRFEESGRLEETRARYAVRGMQWFRFEKGKVKYIEEYLQSVPVLPEGTP